MTSWHAIQSLPIAWDYPPRGGTHHTCGHFQPYPHSAYEVLDYWGWDNGEMVEFGGWTACPPCALKLKVSGLLIDVWVPEE